MEKTKKDYEVREIMYKSEPSLVEKDKLIANMRKQRFEYESCQWYEDGSFKVIFVKFYK